jgi:hypothetical protein
MSCYAKISYLFAYKIFIKSAQVAQDDRKCSAYIHFCPNSLDDIRRLGPPNASLSILSPPLPCICVTLNFEQLASAHYAL